MDKIPRSLPFARKWSMPKAFGTEGPVSGVANNGFGIAGVSYNARILPICVFYLGYDPSVGRNVALCNDSDLIRAYAYLMGDDDGDGRTLAQETNTRVVNMSLGSYVADAGGEDKALEDVIDKAAETTDRKSVV